MKKWKNRILAMGLSIMLTAGLGLPSMAITLNEPIRDPGVLALLAAIRPLGTVASVMNTAAHPDDEHSATLAKLSLGQGVRGSILTVTRGQGGQNEIGPELGDAMGVLRTRETQEAAKALNISIDFVREEFDSPAIDFGFSKKWEEAYEKWDIKFVTERMAYQIRKIRPDVIIIPFNNVRGTHGHHQAIMQITVDAVKAAADPALYKEQNLPAWQVKKVYEPGSEKAYQVQIDVGEYDRFYGQTYQQLGEESRRFHACQGMGRIYEAASKQAYYSLVEDSGAQITSAGTEKSFFDGIAFDFNDLAKQVQDAGNRKLSDSLAKLQKDYQTIANAYPNFDLVADSIFAMISDVNATITELRASSLDEKLKADILTRLEIKQEQLQKAAFVALQIEIKVQPKTSEIIPGQAVPVTVRIHQGSEKSVRLSNAILNLPEGWKAQKTQMSGSLGKNNTILQEFLVTAPLDATLFHPFRDSILSAEVTLSIGSNTRIVGKATPQKQFAVLPEFSVRISPEKIPVNTKGALEPIDVNVDLVNNAPGAASGVVTLNVPAGWSIEPASRKVAMKENAEAKSVSFKVTPAAGTKDGKYQIDAQVQSKKLLSNTTIQNIEYPHIGKTYYPYKAKANVSAFELNFDPALKIGYVSTGFDTIDQTLRELGMDVTSLAPDEVRFGDLSKYGTIVLGIRAYGFRDDVLESNDRLMDYVKKGGNLVVQYHKTSDRWSPNLAPYPITIGPVVMDWRITYEDSPVKILKPDHPFFNKPNVIDETAWQGWIQERSTYQPSEWSDKYQALVQSGLVDQEGATYNGMLLTVPYGEGTYTYTTFVWFRQVPELVPGAVKIFVNIIS